MDPWTEWEEWVGQHGVVTRKCMKRKRKPKKQGNLIEPKKEEFKDCDKGNEQGIVNSVLKSMLIV